MSDPTNFDPFRAKFKMTFCTGLYPASVFKEGEIIECNLRFRKKHYHGKVKVVKVDLINQTVELEGVGPLRIGFKE